MTGTRQDAREDDLGIEAPHAAPGAKAVVALLEPGCRALAHPRRVVPGDYVSAPAVATADSTWSVLSVNTATQQITLVA